MEPRLANDGAWYLAQQPLHPAQGALSAAEQELAGLAESLAEADLLLMVGEGLGWHARAVMERSPAVKVLVYEPNPRTRALAAALGPDLAGVEVIGEENDLLARLSQVLVYATGQRMLIFGSRAYRAALPELWSRINALVAEQTRRGRVDHLNRAAKRGQWLNHLEHNIKRLLELPDITRLAGRYRGTPALVVGAGPSLDHSLPVLAGRNLKHVLTLAAASALGPLARHNLAPNIALALEAKDESRQMANADPGRTLLAAASTSHPNHFAKPPGCRALFHLSLWLPPTMGQGLALANGGHATSAAFTLAVLLGCDPIVLVGQDLAYSQDRSYAQGRVGGESPAESQRRRAPGIGGGTVETSVVMDGYIAWYREAAAYVNRQAGATRLVNATAFGALLPGFEHRDLAGALGDLLVAKQNIEQPLEVIGQLAPPPTWKVAQGLGQARSELRKAQNIVASQGVNALKRATVPDSVVAEAWDLMPDNANPTQARAALDEMGQALTRMAEEIYAHA